MGWLYVFLFGLLVQFPCAYFIKNKFLRHAPLLVTLGLILVAVYHFHQDLYGIYYLIPIGWLILAGMSFVGYLVGWNIYFLVKKIKSLES